jgi:hypothetical protein
VVPDPIGDAVAAADLDRDGDLDLAIVNSESDDVSILLNRRVMPESTEAVAAAGGSVSTDAEGDGAATTDPIETTVTTPMSGHVSIAEGPITTVPPSGFVLFGQQVDIDAPAATPEDPIVIAFEIDASRVPPGEDETTLAVLEDGTFVPNCAGPMGFAAPDPCVSIRERLADGDIRITVRTSSASAWNFGTYRLELPTELLIRLRSDVFGPDLVRVFSPWRYRLDVNLIQDDDQDGRDEISGTMLPFEALGSSGHMGVAVVRLRAFNQPPFQPSPVSIEEAAGQIAGVLEVLPFGPAGAAFSTISLLLELEFPDLNLVLHNVVPLRLGAPVSQWPPAIGEDWQLPQQPIPLLTEQGKPAGIDVVAATARTGLEVPIQIKPGAIAKKLNPNSDGLLPVAILSSVEFDAPHRVDPVSLGFGKTGAENSLARRGRHGVPRCSVVDVNSDGRRDLVCRFAIPLTGLQQGDVRAVLRGRTIEGLAIGGASAILVRSSGEQ